MSLLSELLAESWPAANPANSANPHPVTPPPQPKLSKLAKLATVREIAGGTSEPDTAKVRAHLQVLAEAEYLGPELVRALPESELVATAEQCAALEAEEPGSGRALARHYLRMLATSATMRAGRLPADFDTPALCTHCGPVWLPRSQAAMLDVVDGWPRALGCPWCFIPKGGPLAIPRPPVTCGTCRHFARDTVNPSQGIGTCALGVRWKGRPMYPFTERQCGSWRPSEGRP